jgi:tetrahydromethanopterin S-methyltransferase subunit G
MKQIEQRIMAKDSHSEIVHRMDRLEETVKNGNTTNTRGNPTEFRDEMAMVRTIKNEMMVLKDKLAQLELDKQLMDQVRQYFSTARLGSTSGSTPESGFPVEQMSEERVLNIIKDSFPEHYQRTIGDVQLMIDDQIPAMIDERLPRRQDLEEICNSLYTKYDSIQQKGIEEQYRTMANKIQELENSLKRLDDLQTKVVGIESNIKTTASVIGGSIARTTDRNRQISEQVNEEIATLQAQVEELQNKSSNRRPTFEEQAEELKRMNAAREQTRSEAGNPSTPNERRQPSTTAQTTTPTQKEGPPRHPTAQTNSNDPNMEPPNVDAHYHAGYVHMTNRERAISSDPLTTSQLITNNFLWKKAFKTRLEAEMWLEEDEPSPATNRRNPIDLTGTSSNEDNHPHVPSPPRFPTPWSAEARASRPPVDYHSHDDRGADRSPEGYFADGTGFIHDTRGYKVPLHNQPRNDKYAGQYIPNQRECDRMQRALEREEYRDKYGPNEYRDHFGSPTSSHSSYQNVNRYDNHPG